MILFELYDEIRLSTQIPSNENVCSMNLEIIR